VEKSIRILIVEDDEGNALLEQDTVSDHFRDCSVDIARNGAECMKLLKQKDYDVILLDQNLPDTKGLSLFEKCRKAGFDIPTVMVTGTGNEEIAVEAMKMGAHDYIVKTIDLGYLKTLPLVIQKSLARRRMERELEEARTKEIELERLKAVREIVVSLSHEINNPLCVVLGIAQLMLLRARQFDRKTVDQLKSIEQQAQRIQELTHKLNQIDRLYTTSYAEGCTMIDIERSAGGDAPTHPLPPDKERGRGGKGETNPDGVGTSC